MDELPADDGVLDDEENPQPSEVLRAAGEQLLRRAATVRVDADGGPLIEDRLLVLCGRVGRVEYLRSDHESMLEYERESVDEPGRQDRDARRHAFEVWCIAQLTDCALLALQLAVAVYVTVAPEYQQRPQIIAEISGELMSELAMEASSLTRWGALDSDWQEIARELHICMGSIASAVATAVYEWQEGRFVGQAGVVGIEIAAQTLAHAARIADACDHPWPDGEDDPVYE